MINFISVTVEDRLPGVGTSQLGIGAQHLSVSGRPEGLCSDAIRSSPARCSAPKHLLVVDVRTVHKSYCRRHPRCASARRRFIGVLPVPLDRRGSDARTASYSWCTSTPTSSPLISISRHGQLATALTTCRRRRREAGRGRCHKTNCSAHMFVAVDSQSRMKPLLRIRKSAM
jgi:hypothetical protein